MPKPTHLKESPARRAARERNWAIFILRGIAQQCAITPWPEELREEASRIRTLAEQAERKLTTK